MKLIQLAADEYVVTDPDTGVFFRGNLKDAMEVMEQAGITAFEVSRALEDFRKNGNNYADFGVEKTFIFSLNTMNVVTTKEAA